MISDKEIFILYKNILNSNKVTDLMKKELKEQFGKKYKSN